MTEFLFIRHGETEMNTRPDLIGGRSNHTPLTERGKKQAAKVGEYLLFSSAYGKPAAIYSSPAIRAVSTGLIVCAEAGLDALPIVQDERLLEISQGMFEGMPRDGVYNEENRIRYHLDELDGKLPTGESVLDAQIRKRSFLDETHERHPDGLVIVFGHGLAIRSLAGQIQQLEKPAIVHGLKTNNVSLTRIDVVDHIPTVHFVGKTVITE